MKTTVKIFAVVMLAMTLFACTSKNSPKGVVNAYLECMDKNEYAKSLDLIYFKAPLSEDDKAQLAELLEEKSGKEIEKKGGIVSHKVTNVEMAENGNSAQVSYEVVYDDGSKKEDVQKVVLVDGKWLLDAGK